MSVSRSRWCSLSLLAALAASSIAQAQFLTPVLGPRWYFRSIGANPGSSTTVVSVSADGQLLYGTQGPPTGRQFIVAEPPYPGRYQIGAIPANAFATGIVAADGASTIVSQYTLNMVSSPFRSALSNAGSPWFEITNILQPAYSGVSAVGINASGSWIVGRAVDVGAGQPISFVFQPSTGAFVPIDSFLPNPSGAQTVNAYVTEIAAYRDVVVGYAVYDNITSEAFIFDLRSFTGQLIPNQLNPNYLPIDVRVSGDGLTVAVSAVEPASPTFPWWDRFGLYTWRDNGVTQTATTLAIGLPSWIDISGLNETGQTAVGTSGVLMNGTFQAVSAIVTSIGASTGPLSFCTPSDISARDGIIGGNGLNQTTGRMEGFALRFPEVNIRSDFNHSGGCFDVLDIVDFGTAFAAGNLSADWNYDGALTPLDQQLFSTDWNNCK